MASNSLSYDTLTPEETQKLVILYRIWGRIFFSQYIPFDLKLMRKNTVYGLYIPIIDFIAVKGRVHYDILSERFHDIDSILNQLKDGYLIREQSKHEYRLDPEFLQNIAPLVTNFTRSLESQISNSQKGEHHRLICMKCKQPVDRMYKELGLKDRALECFKCRSTNIKEIVVDSEQTERCKSLLEKIRTWVKRKEEIQQDILKKRENQVRKEKEIKEEKVAKSSFEELKERIPKKKVLGEKEEKVVNDYYDNQYVQEDYVMKEIMKESWVDKLKKVREKRNK